MTMKPNPSRWIPTKSALLAILIALGPTTWNTALAQNDRLKSDAPSKNIVIMLADDLGWGDVGFHGGIAETPNIDRLAIDGLQLDRFYAYPACSPSRAAMLTGRFPHRYGITGPVRPRDEGLPLSERLMVADFQDAGYQTALIGKWHLSHTVDPSHHPTRRGFDHFYGFLDASVDYYQHTTSRGLVDWQRNGKTINEEGYVTDLLTNEAVNVISSRDKGKPLCMIVAYSAPHSPFQAPERLVGKYRDRLGDREATYAAMIDSLDQGIGKILSAIGEQGMANDTIVVFASDNGAARLGTNAPLRGQKRQVYEGGIRVPCVIHAPGITKPGTISDQLFAIHDLLPTLASATGVPIESQKPLDGVDLWRDLIAGQPKERCMVIGEMDLAIFKGNWKLVQSSASRELYNLDDDPNEQQNLAPLHPQIVDQLAHDLDQFQQSVANDRAFSSEVSKARVLVSKTVNAVVEGSSLENAVLQGDAKYGVLGSRLTESNGNGIRLMSGVDHDEDQQIAGEASIINTEVTPKDRWYRFDIHAMAQDRFLVDKDNLFLKVEFLQTGQEGSLDFIKRRIYPQVVQERQDLRDEATNKSLGQSTWRTYAMDFRTPFAEIDAVKLSVGFADGKGEGNASEFWVNSMNLNPIPVPSDYKPPTDAGRNFPQPNPEALVALGGRWYFDPQGGSSTLPKQFDYTNADQLLYKSDRFEAPFAGNMSSWLRAGYKDFDGNIVQKDQHKPYSVVIDVTDDHIVMRSRNLPNHPTATFPDKWRMLDGNPSYIQEKANTWYLPKLPKLAIDPIAMDAKNSNGALPMGPVGVATNGVIFFNPFDHIFETDAVWRLDRCCGHPSPQSAYHYHKYPVCVKTPWSDEGTMHSSVIGFAFDGLPVYGPYEGDGLLAKDDLENPLNDFNLHEDDTRGPHYHVTPGKFPHIIGGYWGEVDPLNGRGRRRR